MENDALSQFLKATAPQMPDKLIAHALAFLIGWNRELETRSAGLGANDPEAIARVLTGGIGFIGAGAIIKDGHHIAIPVCLFTAGTLYLLTPLTVRDTGPEP